MSAPAVFPTTPAITAPQYVHAAPVSRPGRARTVAAGLRAHFREASAVIVNADGGSRDGTSDVILGSTDGLPTIAGAYVGPPGKGSAFRAIFEVATQLGVEACAVVDSDLRSITPEWVGRLISPIQGRAGGYVPPLQPPHQV